MNYKFFTSESVAEGHPDKICDQISDAILDACLTQDEHSHVAVETLVTVNRVVLAGEVKSKANVDFCKIARKTIRKIGYKEKYTNFNYNSPINNYIHQQSPDISLGVDKGGAGDQGMMFGYATNETSEMMPLPITLAHKLVKRLDWVRKKKIIPYLRPDGKSEVKVRYEKGVPVDVDKLVIAAPHDPEISMDTLKKELYREVVLPVLHKYKIDIDYENFIINGTGRWIVGGPSSDTGVTGRKIIVDTYGGVSRQGGGCFSGKDPTKVDRSAAYAARFIAKNIVKRKFARKCEVQIAYVIGYRQPITKSIDTFDTELVDVQKIDKFAWSLIDLSVWGIIKTLNLQKPIYQPTSYYGHFGNARYPWEEIVD